MSPRALQTRLKWTARIIGLLVCIFFFLFAIREVIPAFNQESDVTSLYFILLLSVVVVGYVASWQWELPGAFIQLIGGISMFIFLEKENEIFLGLIFGTPFVFTGALLIYSYVVWKLRDVE
ncbi:hypothetical protein BH11BAC1_BH11BAC1_17080 [soil metagenome]